jgi:hypothetical protein
MSIDFADITRAIQARLSPQAWPQTPVAFENSAFIPPADGSAWMRLSVMERNSQQPVHWAAPETAAARLSGAIYIVGYVPQGTGDAGLDLLLTAAKAVFEGQTFAGSTSLIRVQASSSVLAGPEAPWFKKLITLPFWATPL